PITEWHLIVNLLADAGLTERDISEVSGVMRSTVRRWRNAETVPQNETAYRIKPLLLEYLRENLDRFQAKPQSLILD
ncbi:MAG: XRE family transcriptional regulator, partial [Hymenobacter sp.]